jgi:hypothetical protein
MKNIIAAALFVWCSGAMAGDLPDLGEPSPGRYELSKGQIAAETAFVALMYVDYRQTMDIRGWCDRNTSWRNGNQTGLVIHHPDGTVTAGNGSHCDAHEGNPLLGEHPSDARIRNYFVGATLAHVAIAKVLPTEYRPYWLGAGIIMELAQVIKNKQVGLSASF